MKLKVSVIILNYNGQHFLKDCFDSVFNSSYLADEVIMVDNASTDGSVEFIKKNYPQVKIIQSSKNLGFAQGNNLGIKAASGDYLAILNNDTEVDKKWLEELKMTLDNHQEVGFCASKMVWLKDPKIIDGAGIIYSWKGKAYNRGSGEKDKGQYDLQEYVFGACNGASFYRRSLLDKIGLLDENFFLICDDVDMSFRAQIAGFKCLYVPKAMVKHAGGGTVSRWTGKKASFSARHHIYIILKNFPLKFIVSNFPQILVERLRNLSGVIKSVSWWQVIPAVWETYWQILIKLPEMIKKRNKIQKMKVVSDDYLSSIIRRADFKAD